MKSYSEMSNAERESYLRSCLDSYAHQIARATVSGEPVSVDALVEYRFIRAQLLSGEYRS